MERQKVLMLWPVKTDYWPRNLNKSGIIDVDSTFKKQSVFGNIVRKICCLIGIKLDFFVEDWKNNINQYDVIIIQASKVTRFLPNYIRKKNFKGRLIYWFWDPVSGSIVPSKINRELCELWSFDYDDCVKYNMRYNDTFYILDESVNTKQENEIKYDVCYVGRDKGRLEELLRIEKRLNDFGLRTNFYIVATKPYSLNRNKLNKPIDYEKVLQLISESKAILDLNQKSQSGLSMRCMEALFFNKKIITNNSHVFDKIDFEGKMTKNIDRLDDDLIAFINQEDVYYDNSEELKKYYSFKSWLNRILEV